MGIGSIHDSMGEYSKALSYLEKVLQVLQEDVAQSHPDLVAVYSKISSVYVDMGEYPKALSSVEKAFEIAEKTFPPNHSMLATPYVAPWDSLSKAGRVFQSTFHNHEKALEIRQKTLLPNHPDFVTCYSNISLVYVDMSEYPKALSSIEKAFVIAGKTFPSDHASLTTSYWTRGLVYQKLGEHSKALSYYEKALKIQQKTLLPTHLDLAQSYNNMDLFMRTWASIPQHFRILKKRWISDKELFLQLILIWRNPTTGMACVTIIRKKKSKMLSFFERALEIWQCSLPPNHPNVKAVRQSIESIKKI